MKWLQLTFIKGVAYAFPPSDKASLDDIEVVEDWGPQMKFFSRIPSLISYSPASNPLDQQWGASISEDAVVLKNVKKELDVPSRVAELEFKLQTSKQAINLDFENVTKSNGDPPLRKTPEQIVTDYLAKVFQYLKDPFEFLGQHLKSKIPVDIVVTVPVVRLYIVGMSTVS